jgi:hypothetical protein
MVIGVVAKVLIRKIASEICGQASASRAVYWSPKTWHT